MNQSIFLWKFKQGGVYLGNGWFLGHIKRKRIPGAYLERIDVNTRERIDDSEIEFETLYDAYEYKIDGTSIKEIIDGLTGKEDEELPMMYV